MAVLSRRARSRVEVVLALLLFLAIVVPGGVGIYYVVTHNQPSADPATIPSTAAGAPADRDVRAVEDAQRLARAFIVEWSLPGLSIAAARDGAIVWAEGFGCADGKRHKVVTPRTRFRTGSVSKTLTAAAVALLYDRKRIDLDTPVQNYVSEYPNKQWTVTTRQLLGDVAGVHRIRGDSNDQIPRGYCKTVSEALRTFAYEPLLFEPGTHYRFSTSGWILLSAVVEGAAGEPFPTFMSHDVFTPLGMDRTVLEGTDEDPDSAAAHVRCAYRIRAGLEGRQPSARRRNDARRAPSRQSDRWLRHAVAISGTRAGDCRHVQRSKCVGGRARPAGRGRVRPVVLTHLGRSAEHLRAPRHVAPSPCRQATFRDIVPTRVTS